MEIKKGTKIKLRDDLKVGEIYGGIRFTERMDENKNRFMHVEKKLSDNVFLIVFVNEFNISYEMIDSVITFYDFQVGDRVVHDCGFIGTVGEVDKEKGYTINFDNGKQNVYGNIHSLTKVKSEEKIHRDEKFKLSELTKFVKECKETKEEVNKLGEIAELYKEQIEAVQLIQKQLQTIIKKHDGLNIDIDVVIDNKIKEKIKDITKNLTELGF